MTETRGFGKAKPQPKSSKRSQERTDAAKQLDKMRADGLPEYEVYIRIQGKKQWYPVGALAVQRSSQINHAIYDSQAQLLQGAFRLFPILKKNQTQLEYGYRLKEYKDEPIQLAVEPKSKLPNPVQGAIAAVGDRLSGLFKRS
ncbi:hypothetical protein IFO70_35940 [Phormidium tenue FACHB-886]|nr:hypothetical protein [Phormidium tenue FACHB-886]